MIEDFKPVGRGWIYAPPHGSNYDIVGWGKEMSTGEWRPMIYRDDRLVFAGPGYVFATLT